VKRYTFLFLLLSSVIYCDSLSVIFLGDTHFGENYQFEPKFNHGENIIAEYGYDYFFENVKNFLLSSDVTFCNLETPLIKVNSSTLPVSIIKPYLHWSDPDSTIKYFRKYHINNVTIGNNHVFDYGLEGYNSTVRYLNSAGLNFFGAGNDPEEASKPLVKDINGYKLIIFGGFEYRSKYDTLYDFYAGENKPGVNKLDTVQLTADIKKYRSEFPDAVIIIYPHWGSNYKPAGDMQKTFARNYINAGADLVIGHGAHTVQEAEFYNGKWIFYNLGNFIFNAPGRYRSTGAKPYGLMLKLIMKNSSMKFVLYPVFINNYESDYSLRKLDDDETEDMLQILFQGKYHISFNDENFPELTAK